MANPQQTLKTNNYQDDNALLDAALNSLAKAMKALNFYPPEHPQRDESLSAAFLQLSPLVREQELALLWSRDACTVADRPSLKSTSTTARTLAREMLTRKLQRLIILPELTEKDLKAFLSLFAVDAAVVLTGGGIEKAMARAGIYTLGANEVDLAFLKSHSMADETGEDVFGGNPSEEEESSGAGATAMQTPEVREDPEMSDLLERLRQEQEEQPYLQLVREVIDLAEILKKREQLIPIMPALAALLQELGSPARSQAQQEFTKHALEQLTDGAMTEFILDQIEGQHNEYDKMLATLCATIGRALAYPLIQRLCIAESLHTRKAIAKALTKTGDAGTTALISMLRDERWHVVRNMVTILGEIGSPEAIKALQMTARHPEAKVRKEVVKSLLKVAPQSVDNTLISLLTDIDRDVVRQVIFALGALRSRAAVRHLLEIIAAADAFLKNIELKKQAVAALGRIGDHQATAVLMDILTVRGWLAPRRWLELKTAAAVALGQLGDESALPLLQQLAKLDSPLGEACIDAADNLERVVR